MKTYQIKLTPQSPFEGIPASDTLFGAICWGILRIYGEEELEGILKGFESHSKSFILSSSFPYLEDGGIAKLSFYPKPVTQGLTAFDINDVVEGVSVNKKGSKGKKVEVMERYKEFKRSEYLSQTLFERFLNGLSEKEIFKDFFNGKVRLKNKMLMTFDEHRALFNNSEIGLLKTELVQKNSIDRFTMSTGGTGETFYQSEYYFSSIFRLHFLIRTDEIDYFKPVFRYLEDNGIGGNRSTGKGRFRIEIVGEVSLGKEGAKQFVSLSRYIPDPREIRIESNTMYYELLPYRSKIDSEAEFKGEDVWKARVLYCREGSCFEATEIKDWYGCIPVVKKINGKNIYQNGLAFPVFGNFGGSR